MYWWKVDTDTPWRKPAMDLVKRRSTGPARR